MKTNDDAVQVRLGQRVMRTLIVTGSLGLLAAMSFVFMPPERGEPVAPVATMGRAVRPVIEDRSPLRGVRLEIPDMTVRRLDRVAVVTFSCDVFDAKQELRADARAKLEKLAEGLHTVRNQIAIEIAGYAPDAADARGYATGVMRAARVADCIAGIARIPPSAIAMRSLADTEVRGPADRPHAVVIMISSADELAREVAQLPGTGI